MTAPNFNDPEQMPDAVNAGSGISGASTTSPEDHIQGAFDQIGGPLGGVAGWLLGGLAQKVYSDAADSAQESGATNSYATAASKTFGRIGTMKSQVESPIALLAKAVFGGWFGSSAPAVGTPQEVQYTIEAIRQAVINGYTVDTIAFSGNYAVPDCTEFGCILIGGGETGENGQLDQRRSLGGRGGGYITALLDAPALQGQTLTFTIGSAGSATTVKWGSTVLASAAPGSAGGMAAGVWGYGPTTSTPGAGGRGGAGQSGRGQDGEPGESSALGAGGARGLGGNTTGSVGVYGDPGKAGANVSAGSLTKCGGGGGGGGGGGAATLGIEFAGGAGGPGGYPGGGGGGGGGAGRIAGGGVNGAGGIGAVGCAWAVWK